MSRPGVGHVRPAAVSAPVEEVKVAAEGVIDVVTYETEEYSGFGAFISDGCVSFTGSDVKVPVKVLQDTGVRDSFILSMVFPFSQDSDTEIVYWCRKWI